MIERKEWETIYDSDLFTTEKDIQEAKKIIEEYADCKVEIVREQGVIKLKMERIIWPQ